MNSNWFKLVMKATKVEYGRNLRLAGAPVIFNKRGARLKLLNDVHGGDAADLIPSREIHIGKNCFIGCNTIILKGTILGDGCVVGAGAVVSGKFEDNCVIAGNPARVIRKLGSK